MKPPENLPLHMKRGPARRPQNLLVLLAWSISSSLGLPSALGLHQARAQGQAASSDTRGSLPLSAFDDDPIGIDPNAPPPDQPVAQPKSNASPPPAPAIDTRYGPTPRRGRAIASEVLTAMPSVRETLHEVRVVHGSGLGQVNIHLRLANSVDEPAEALYRLNVPKDAVPVSLRACVRDACRDGLIDASQRSPSTYDAALLARGPQGPTAIQALPIAELRPTDDERGHFLALHAAPVRAGNDVDLWLSYLVRHI